MPAMHYWHSCLCWFWWGLGHLLAGQTSWRISLTKWVPARPALTNKQKPTVYAIFLLFLFLALLIYLFHLASPQSLIILFQTQSYSSNNHFFTLFIAFHYNWYSTLSVWMCLLLSACPLSSLHVSLVIQTCFITGWHLHYFTFPFCLSRFSEGIQF